MEPHYSVLIFSKYSANCKKMFDLVNNSGIDFDRVLGNKLQLLCIDNDKIRKRIKENKQIDISTVPCILSIFPNGGVEKYDGAHSFAWVENLISKYAPPPPQQQYAPPPQQQYAPPPQQQYAPPPRQQYVQDEEDEEEEEKPVQVEKKKKAIPKRMKKIATSIDDIPLDDSDIDRHRNLPQPRRIRQDEGNYIEDEDLFGGEVIDHRVEPKNIVRASTSDRKNSADVHGVRAKADELAKGREDLDKQFGTPNNRPLDGRRP